MGCLVSERRGAIGVPPGDRLRVFFDADVLIAGAASGTGASHLLLRLSELGLVQGVTCSQAVREAERNLREKLPAALPVFRAILAAAEITVIPDVRADSLARLQGLAHQDDLPILAAALEGKSDYLTTFNVRHYQVSGGEIRVARPGEVVARLRRVLADMG
jgi:predicted nucleic acid-binding protein